MLGLTLGQRLTRIFRRPRRWWYQQRRYSHLASAAERASRLLLVLGLDIPEPGEPLCRPKPHRMPRRLLLVTSLTAAADGPPQLASSRRPEATAA